MSHHEEGWGIQQMRIGLFIQKTIEREATEAAADELVAAPRYKPDHECFPWYAVGLELPPSMAAAKQTADYNNAAPKHEEALPTGRLVNGICDRISGFVEQKG